MKVRWMSGSLRLRVSPEEFDELRSGGEVVESLGAPGRGGWTATCVVGVHTGAAIDGGSLTFTLSADDMGKLAQHDVEGLYFADDGPEPFRYYIEKNFPCAHPHPPEASAMDPHMGTFAPTPSFADRKRKPNCD
ncbi:MAG TPA: hypothetical protein VGK19_26250 [Capsulimonadaceae bacterium]|jgi:hypothetical protein